MAHIQHGARRARLAVMIVACLFFSGIALYAGELFAEGRATEIIEENGLLEFVQLITSSLSAFIFLFAAWRSATSPLKTAAILLGLLAIAIVVRESEFAFLEHSAGIPWLPRIEINDISFTALGIVALGVIAVSWRQIPAIFALATNTIAWPLYLTVICFAVGMASDIVHIDTMKVHIIEETSETLGHVALFVGALRHAAFLAQENKRNAKFDG